jgi:hypothetical protein
MKRLICILAAVILLPLWAMPGGAYEPEPEAGLFIKQRDPVEDILYIDEYLDEIIRNQRDLIETYRSIIEGQYDMLARVNEINESVIVFAEAYGNVTGYMVLLIGAVIGVLLGVIFFSQWRVYS